MRGKIVVRRQSNEQEQECRLRGIRKRRKGGKGRGRGRREGEGGKRGGRWWVIATLDTWKPL